MNKQVNKWEMISVVLASTLGADDKNLLIELIGRCDYEKHGNWDCWPSVQRLAQVRGVKYEKNFNGVEAYLPGLVTKRKAGRKNVYTLNVPAIMALPPFETVIKHTPSVAGSNTPALADNTPAVAENTPAVAGANSTLDNTKDSTEDSTKNERAGAHSLDLSLDKDKDESNVEEVGAPRLPNLPYSSNSPDSSLLGLLDWDSPYQRHSSRHTPSRAGVL